ncbi:MAG: type II 3-dehydroquinate dehydratase [Firmicutes bacterium]|nr:type II 3-dehydroquinate dehydratase [Bacillota bacterium]
MNKLLVIHGPNLNMLGKREHKHYDSLTLEEVNEKILHKAKENNFKVDIYQSNSEGEIITKLHSAIDKYQGIIINPGAYTHYSIAIRDALKILTIPIIEVHLSNIYSREEFRHNSVIAPVCTGQISGLGHVSYLIALDAFKNLMGGYNE